MGYIFIYYSDEVKPSTSKIEFIDLTMSDEREEKYACTTHQFIEPRLITMEDKNAVKKKLCFDDI